MSGAKKQTISSLREQILLLQGIKQPSLNTPLTIGFPPLEAAFPFATFPTGTLHEFISSNSDAAATSGFVSCLLGKLMQQDGISVWAGLSRTVFPAALKTFGVDPDKVVFITVKNEKDLAWVIEESLKCGKLTAVIGEIKNISLTASRRLTLAIEQSKVTGFVVRHDHKDLNPLSCFARWRITSLASHPAENMPGLGFPRWNVDLLKVRSGRPGSWQIEWHADHFEAIAKETPSQIISPMWRTAS